MIRAILRGLVLCAGCGSLALIWAQSDDTEFVDQEPWVLELKAHSLLQRTREQPGVTLAPFVSDGCSGGQSAAWSMVAARFPELAEVHGETPPWESCCVSHDRSYHAGGEDPDPEASARARLHADRDLENCVIDTGRDRVNELAASYGMSADQVDSTYGFIAASMFAAVRAGGLPCSGLSWRWGYGYPQCRWFE